MTLKKLQQEFAVQHDDNDITGLQSLSDRRFTTRHSAYSSLLKNFERLIELLQSVNANDGDGKIKANATRLLDSTLKFKTFFACELSKDVFTAAEQISQNLQSGSLDAQTVSASVDMYVRFLKQMRTDGMFEKFYASCVSESGDKHGCDPPQESVPRGRRVPKRYDEGAAAHQWNGPEKYFKVQYFQVLDFLSNEMTSHFDGGMLGKLEFGKILAGFRQWRE